MSSPAPRPWWFAALFPLVAALMAACGARSALLEAAAPTIIDNVDAGAFEGNGTSSDAASGESSVASSSPDGGGAGQDSGSSEIDATGIPQVAECLQAPNEIYVVATGGYGGAGLSGASHVAGAQGTWLDLGGGNSFVQVDSPEGGWAFAASANTINHGPYILEPGATFNSGPGLTENGAYAQVAVGSAGGCNPIPTGTFTIVDIANANRGDGALLRLLAWFSLSCGDGGRLDGCVRYTR
jgi:hypothetical protein